MKRSVSRRRWLLLLAWAVAATVAADWRAISWHDPQLIPVELRERPRFIYVTAPWCSWCQQYERDTLGDPAIAALLESHYTPVLVDYDARPDVTGRLGVRGLPFTAITTASGTLLNSFVGILRPADLADLLRQFAANVPVASVPAAPEVIARPGAVDAAAFRRFESAFLAHVETIFDADIGTLAGSFETGAGFKRPAPLTWRYLADRELWRERGLAAARVESRRLLDRLDGGFFFFLDPHRRDYLETSKLLEANAWLAAWLGKTGRRYDDAVLRRAALSGFYFIKYRLHDQARGGFFQAQLADNDYYSAPPQRRLARNGPGVMKVKRADTNAQAAMALLDLADALGIGDARVLALDGLRFVLNRMLLNGKLVHVLNGDRPGVAVDLPRDLLWLLAAARRLEETMPGQLPGQALMQVGNNTRAWLQSVLKKDPRKVDNEVLGLVAWLAVQQPGQWPAGTIEWSIKGLRIEAETSPDELVFGLRAFERYTREQDTAAPDGSDRKPVQ